MEMNWRDHLSTKEITSIEHAQYYADHFASAGAPGHGQYLLIAKLVTIMDEMQIKLSAEGKDIIIKKVVYDEDRHCWRDTDTGVIVRDVT